MYSAKERGGDRQEIYDSELHARTQGRRALEQAVRDGLEHDRLGLAFQPVVDIDSGEVVGAEALMRLTASDGALVPTLPAILAAEQAGLAELVGDRVQDLALRALKGWPDALTVAVNVSARELTGNDFHRRVETCLGRHDVDPRRLILEITESSMLHSGPAALQSLSRLRDLGVRVAIDDFGMAYATLQNLLVLPVDVLKVDTTFTAGLTRSKAAAAVVHGIASMAFEMDIPCIVEGIETEEQLDALRGMSVLGQGWLWGRPRTDDAAPPRISAPRARAAAD
jgi:EAL domain-containing protein (putative c-di-GMP-specific phosphodiesterase class I)